MHSSYVQVQMQIINMYIFFSVVLVLAQASLWNFIFYFLFIFYTRVLLALPVVWSLRVLPKFDKTQSMLKRIRNCHCFWPINFWLMANWPGVTAVRTKQPLTLINKLSLIWKNSQVSQVLLYYMTKKETSVSILTCTARSAYIINNKLALSANQ